VVTEAKISYKSWAALALSAAFLLVFAFVTTQQIRERPANEEPAKTASDESFDQPVEVPDHANDGAAQIRQSAARTEAPESTVKELVQAWNQGDADKIAALFLPDGVLRLPTGSEIKTREEIRNTIAKHHGGMLRDTTLTNRIEGVSTADGDNAVIKGSFQLDGIKVLGFSTSSTGTFEFVGAKREGRWLISRAEVTGE
jgi:uncharacterized protein (TIGR02246 family)